MALYSILYTIHSIAHILPRISQLYHQSFFKHLLIRCLHFLHTHSVRYYALLAIGVLVSNKEIETAVTASGTLALVLPFIETHDPVEFAQHETSHRYDVTLAVEHYSFHCHLYVTIDNTVQQNVGDHLAR